MVEASVQNKTAILKLRELLHQLYISCATLAVPVCGHAAEGSILVAVYAVAYLLKLWQSGRLLCSCGISAAAVVVTVKAAMVQVMCNFHQQ